MISKTCVRRAKIDKHTIGGVDKKKELIFIFFGMCLPAILLFASIGVASATNYMPQDCYSFTIESAPDTPVSDPKGPYTGTEGVPILFNGSGSYDPDGSIVAYEWDLGDGNNATGATPTHTYTQNGTYTVALTVTDNDGATNTSTTTATIADTEPTADLSATPTSGQEPLTVNFTDNSTSHDGIIAWNWDFNNDNVADSTEQNPTYVYAEEGLYTVSLTVNESDEDSDTMTKVDYITVGSPQPGDVILWDTNAIYDWKGPFYDAVANKDEWTQVPYGVTDSYTWVGDPMIENEHYYLFLCSDTHDSVDLHVKINGGFGAKNEIYKVYDTGTRDFGMGAIWTNILKNTPGEVIVESAGEGTQTGQPVVTTYHIPREHWIEVKPVDRVNQQGMHDKSRLATFLFPSASDDILLDADKHGDFIERVNPPTGCIGEINFQRRGTQTGANDEFMWFLTFPPGTENNSLTYQTMDNPDCYWEWDCRCCVPRSVGQNFAYLGEKVVIGVLNFEDNWKREDVNQPISAGETYTSSFTALYAGKWRVVAVFSDDDHYITDNIREVTVNAGDHFTFTSTRDGTLDYLVMYMVDRTDATADDITTIMDVYRETIGGISTDTTAPSAVADFAASDPTTHSIELTWTAPGDDGNNGTASQYEIRYFTSEISEANWNAATQCTGEPTPQVAGSAETFTVTGLAPNTTYYVALKTADEVPNWAGISNCASETTTEESDLVAEWHLDEGTGEIARDSSGNGNDGTLINDPAWVNGKVGKGEPLESPTTMP